MAAPDADSTPSSDAAPLPVPSDGESVASLSAETSARVLKQVEFYFSVSNLPRDKFLRAEMEKDASGEGFVDLALLCSFSRMRQVLSLTAPNCAIPTSAVRAVAAVLRTSKELVVTPEDDPTPRVRRAAKIEDLKAAESEADGRSVMAKPFPFDTTVDALQTFFADYGNVNAVRMRRHQMSKDFKGSVYVEFDSEATAKAVLEKASVEPGLIFEGAKLDLEFKLSFLDRVKAERLARAEGAQANPELDEDAEVEYGKARGGKDTVLDFPRGVVLSFKLGEGVDIATLRYEALKEALGSYGQVQHVNYRTGNDSGFVRFADEAGCKAALEGTKEGGFEVGGGKASTEAVEGEAEVQYHESAQAAIKAAREKKFQGGFGGGRGRWGKRGRDESGGDRSGKRTRW